MLTINKYIFSILLIFFLHKLEAQKRLILLGFETSGSIGNITKEASGTGEDLYYRYLKFTPKIGFFVRDNFMIGVQAGRSTFKSNFIPSSDYPTIYDAGFLMRYYTKKKMQKKIKLPSKHIPFSILPYFEYNHLWTNHHPRDSSLFTNTGKSLDFQVLNPQLGVNIQLANFISLDIAYRTLFYFDSKNNNFSYQGLAPKVGLEVMLHSKKKNEKK